MIALGSDHLTTSGPIGPRTDAELRAAYIEATTRAAHLLRTLADLSTVRARRAVLEELERTARAASLITAEQLGRLDARSGAV